MENNIIKQLKDPKLARELTEHLKKLKVTTKVRIMEVCGTHTMAIHRMGLPSILPSNIDMLSGPGCPVCVTPGFYLDTAIDMARRYQVLLTTFGDMMRVPGSRGTLTGLRSEGYDVEVVYSPLAALELAQKNPGREIVFLAVGFETTTPVVAATVQLAREQQVGNFSILASHKLVIPALEILVNDPEAAVDGFLLPGHVSIVLGSEPYRFIPETYHRACVIAGFEPFDIVQSVYMLVEQIEKKDYSVEIQYKRTVKPEGNERARDCMFDVFSPVDSVWRGFGSIPESGLAIREKYLEFDAGRRYPVDIEPSPEPKACRCGDVLRGIIKPHGCKLFGTACTPGNPIGPCMVSSEGSCAAYFRYSRKMGTSADA